MYHTFIIRFLFTSLVAVLLVISFDYFIDPFGVHSLSMVKGINDVKYETIGRLTVALRTIHYKPKTIVLGTSRVGGFDRESLQNYSGNEAFFNASLAGASFDEIYSYFLHALYLQPDLKKVIVGIDLFSFNQNRKPQIDFKEERLQKNGYIFSDLKETLFSYKAFSASCETFLRSFFETEKVNPILQMGEKYYLQTMLNSEGNYKNYKLDPEKIKKFQSLVDLCKSNSIDLKVFICPVKVMYWEFYFQNGLWSTLEDLKRQLCASYPIWDFSGYNPLTMETLENEGKPLYHECSHFTSYMGNLLLKRMFDQPSAIDSIGYLLTQDTIEKSLIEILNQRSEWLKNKH